MNFSEEGTMSCFRPLPLRDGEKEWALTELLRAIKTIGATSRISHIEWVEPNHSVAGWQAHLQ
jgi:hypothetical protein